MMASDLDDRRRILDWLDRTGAGRTCSVCGATGAGELGELVATPRAGPSGLIVNASVPRMVQWICGRCGHVALFSAERIGLLTRS